MENFSNKHCIYVHTNLTNGKVYVGQTIGSTYEECNAFRWNSGKGYEGQTEFYNAIKKYGWNGFKHEIIRTDLSQEEANQLESYYIGKYDAHDNGYNGTYGGSGIRRNNRKMVDYIIQSLDNKGQFISATDLGRNGKSIHLVTTHSAYDNCDYTIVDFAGWPIRINWEENKIEIIIYLSSEINRTEKQVATWIQDALTSLGYTFDIEKFYNYNERSLGTPECYCNYITGNHK